MANTCNTTYEMYGSKKSIESLWNTLIALGYDTNNVWLDDLAEYCKIDYKNLGYSVRGEITFASYSEWEDERFHMQILTETAWVGCHDIMKAVIEKAGGEDISVSYMEIEPGCEIYTIHDEQELFPYECYVTACGDFAKHEGEYSTLDAAIDKWAEATHSERIEDNRKMLEAIEQYNHMHEDEGDYYSIHVFDIV